MTGLQQGQFKWSDARPLSSPLLGGCGSYCTEYTRRTEGKTSTQQVAMGKKTNRLVLAGVRTFIHMQLLV